MIDSRKRPQRRRPRIINSRRRPLKRRPRIIDSRKRPPRKLVVIEYRLIYSD